MAETNKSVARIIAACLALAASDNPGEADNAKRQAAALMKKYGLSETDIAAAQVVQKDTKTGGKSRPKTYLTMLAGLIATAFDCEVVMSNGKGWRDSLAMFIGLGAKPELASYTFDVLRRKINKDRAEYAKTKLKRYKNRTNKQRQADLFCDAWLQGIANQITVFAGNKQESDAIAAYMQKKWPQGLKEDKRALPEPSCNRDMDAIAAGAAAADNVSLHKPVQAKAGKKAALTDQRQAELF